MQHELIEGQILGGKYRIDGVLGRGGMGMVVAAHHLVLDQRVAVKFLLPQASANSEAVRRFETEARAAAKLNSEHVVRVLDVGRLDSGAPYMVMDYLDGEDLGAWLAQRGPLPLEQAVDFVLQACVAVADAHKLGIVHRDLKPSNLFCVRRSDGQLLIKIVDFGISKLTDTARAANMPATRTNETLGTPLYMSPEQVKSAKDVDARSDIWSLGVVLFELLAGAPPFMGETFGEVAIKIATTEPASLSSYRPQAPPALEVVLRRCFEKDKQRRYANVAELSVALLPFASTAGKALVERVVAIVQGMAPAVPEASPPTLSNAQPGLRPETISLWSGTTNRTGKKALARRLLLVVAVLSGIIALRFASSDGGGSHANTASKSSSAALSAPSPPPPRPRSLCPHRSQSAPRSSWSQGRRLHSFRRPVPRPARLHLRRLGPSYAPLPGEARLKNMRPICAPASSRDATRRIRSMAWDERTSSPSAF